MASIQQSMNALVGSALGAATTGSYFYRQSPEFRAKQLDKGAKEVQEQVVNLINDLEKIPEGDSISHKAQNQAIVKLAEKRRGLVEQAFDTSPTFDRAKKLAGAERGRVIKAERDRMKQEYAEKKALESLTNKVDTQMEQKQAYKDRLDTLREKASAKERGQLDTMIGRLRNKGEFE